MVLLGTIINAFAIIFGTLIGSFLTKIPDSIKDTVMKAIGLAVIILGIQMGLKSDNFLLTMISIVTGAIIGEYVDLDGKFNSLGNWVEKRVAGKWKGNISQGFITASLIFVIGAMAVLGAMESGMSGRHDILITKAVIDGFTAIILTSTLGIGVLFSALPVFLYQGSIALAATQINQLVPEELVTTFINELTATGGIMIFALGLSLANMLTIKVANLLPGLIVIAFIVPIYYLLF
jgi:uncharacterized protein